MKSIYSLDTWILFLFFLIQIVLENSDIPEIFSLIMFSAELVWFYALTSDLYKKLPGGHFMNISKFRFHFFFPLIYFFLVIFFSGGYSINSGNMGEYAGFGTVLIILHLFSMYCIF